MGKCVLVSVYHCVFSTVNISWVNILCYKAACLIKVFVIETGEEYSNELEDKNSGNMEQVFFVPQIRKGLNRIMCLPHSKLHCLH